MNDELINDSGIGGFKLYLRRLSQCLNKMSPDDIEELRSYDSEIDQLIDNISNMLGASNPYWRMHPWIEDIRCSINGEIEKSGYRLPIREFDGKLKVCFSNSKRRFSAADLVMACFKPCPGDRTKYRICYHDKNFRNIKPANMYWEKL